MAQGIYPITFPTRRIVTLTSGTSWTVPTGVLYINATLMGGGAGQGASSTNQAHPGQVYVTTIATTPGASITYAIGAGGTAGSAGGSTTMTGATTAAGGSLTAGTAGSTASNQGDTAGNGAAGGNGKIEIEYFV